MHRLAVLLSLSGCLVYVPHRNAPGAPGNPRDHASASAERGATETQGEHHARLEREAFPDIVAAIGRADEALTTSQFDDALAAARGAASALQTKLGGTSLDVAATESGERLALQALMLEGLAFRRLGHDLEAVLSLGRLDFNAEGCRLDLRPRCREYSGWLSKTFPTLVGNMTNDVQLRTATSSPIAGELSDVDMRVSEREIEVHKGFAGVMVEPTSVTRTKDGVVLRVDGKTTQGSYGVCNTVGQVQLSDQSLDVKRCHEEGYTAHRADFVATIPAGDASKVTGEKGERLFLVFEVKNWRHNGNVYTSGPARVAFAVRPRG